MKTNHKKKKTSKEMVAGGKALDRRGRDSYWGICQEGGEVRGEESEKKEEEKKK